MKANLRLFVLSGLILALTAWNSLGQVSINITGDPPDNSAMLDVKSSSKGFLPPRMTTTERDAITNPAEGLIIYNNDKKLVEFFNGAEWTQIYYSSSDEVICGQGFKDTRDYKIYSTLQIGTQCWMAENLNFGTKIEGSLDQTDNSTIEKYCYDNSESYCEIYGGLYQWNELMQYTTTSGTQGICPEGWHVPTRAEFEVLTDFLGGESSCGGKMKTSGTIEAGTGLWYTPNTGATNESGFTGMPGGMRTSSTAFMHLGYNADFFTSDESSEYIGMAWGRNLYYGNVTVRDEPFDKRYGWSVRCLKN
jgi:uncharacterized protein (TIGR02145 family)